jgi:hypothetical protein
MNNLLSNFGIKKLIDDSIKFEVSPFIIQDRMSNYELKHIRGIPYYLDGTTIRIFELDNGKPASNCIAIGTYNATSDSITYFTDWRERVKSNLDAFRGTISAQERDKLRESIVKPTKQRKTTRTPRKTTRSKSTKSE